MNNKTTIGLLTLVVALGALAWGYIITTNNPRFAAVIEAVMEAPLQVIDSPTFLRKMTQTYTIDIKTGQQVLPGTTALEVVVTGPSLGPAEFMTVSALHSDSGSPLNASCSAIPCVTTVLIDDWSHPAGNKTITFTAKKMGTLVGKKTYEYSVSSYTSPGATCVMKDAMFTASLEVASRTVQNIFPSFTSNLQASQKAGEVNTPVTLTLSTSLANSQKFQIFKDRVAVKECANQKECSFTWDPQKDSDGQHVFHGVVSNCRLVEKKSSALTFTVKAPAPATLPIPTTLNTSWADKILVVYNTSSSQSVELKNYYLAHRPGMSGVSVLGVSVPTAEVIDSSTYSEKLQKPIVEWLKNSNKKIQYVVLMYGIPSRTNFGDLSSVQHRLSTLLAAAGIRTGATYTPTKFGAVYQYPTVEFDTAKYPGTTALFTHLDMGSVAATKAYIDKIAALHTKSGSQDMTVTISKAYPQTNFTYYLDDEDGGRSYPLALDAQKAISNANSSARVWYSNKNITSGSNAIGYQTWGVNGKQPATYATDGSVKFTGAPGVFIIETIESFNGQEGTWQGNFERWFNSNAFGGSNYSNTPIGAVTHVEEPYSSGINGGEYFGNWERGLRFIDTAWASKRTPYFMAIGDPLVEYK